MALGWSAGAANQADAAVPGRISAGGLGADPGGLPMGQFPADPAIRAAGGGLRRAVGRRPLGVAPLGDGARRRGSSGGRRGADASGGLLAVAPRLARSRAARRVAAGLGTEPADLRAGILAPAPRAVRRGGLPGRRERRPGRAELRRIAIAAGGADPDT